MPVDEGHVVTSCDWRDAIAAHRGDRLRHRQPRSTRRRRSCTSASMRPHRRSRRHRGRRRRRASGRRRRSAHAWRRCARFGAGRRHARRRVRRRPFLGVCVGMQMLFDGSEESRRRRRSGCASPGTITSVAADGEAPADGLEHARGAPRVRRCSRVSATHPGATSCTATRPRSVPTTIVAGWCDYGRPLPGRGRARPGVGDAVPPREERRRRPARCSATSCACAACPLVG